MDIKEEIRQRYDELFKNSHYFIFAYTIDGKLIDINDSMLNALGYIQEEVLGKNITFFIHPDDINEAIKKIEIIKKEGKSESPSTLRVRNKAGNYIYVRLLGIPIIRDEKIGYMFVIGNDITDLKKAESKLEESEEKFRIIAEQSLIGIVILQENQIKYCNQKFSDITGYSIEEIMNWPAGRAFDIVHPDVKDKVKEGASKRQDGSDDLTTHDRFKAIRKNGEMAWIEVYSNTISYKEKPAALVSIVDATQRIKRKEKLKESYEREDLYKDLFAHDTKNLLQTILMSLDLLELEVKSDFEENERVNELIGVIKNEIANGAVLVKNVKRFSDLEKVDESLCKLNLKDALLSASDTIKKLPHQKEIQIDYNGLKDDIFIKADNFFSSLFENILDNAIKFNNNPKAEITINILRKKEEGHNIIKIEFLDNGMGIPDSQKELILTHNIKEKKSISEIGLGLSLVKIIIDRYDGRLRIKNKQPSDHTKGSKIILLLPEAS